MSERTIFLNALELKTPAERAAYLDKECAGDIERRRRIEALLKAHANDDGIVDALAGDSQKTSSMAGVQQARSPATEEEETTDLGFLGPPHESDSLGSIGMYDVLEVIGRGGMGVVLKGRDIRLNRIVAIKVLAPEIASNVTAKKRFEREAQAAAAVSHDHVVTIYAVDEFNNLPYLVMECIVGRSLQQKIDETGPLELKEVLRIGMQAALGLAAAHKQGLVHRDIKPANILLQNGIQRVKITDFGLARATDDVAISQSGQIAGTPLYMSPEQAQGKRVDHASDLFSLGSVLYTMCTGRPAFRAANMVAVLRRVVDDMPRPIREIAPEIPQWLADIIDKLMSKSKEDRFQTAAEVAEVLSARLARIQEPKSSVVDSAVKASTQKKSDETRSRAANVSQAAAGRRIKVEELPELPERSRRVKPVRKETAWERIRSASPLTWLVAGVLVPGMIALIVMMALLLNRDQLLVRIELDESLRQQDVTLVIDGTSYAARDLGPSIRMKPGPHTLEVKRGNEQFKSEQFTIYQNEKPLFRVKTDGGKLSVERADPGTTPVKLVEAQHIAPPDSQDASMPPSDIEQNKKLAFEKPGFDLWSQSVASMPVAGQVKAVGDKLKELNPLFDGNVTPDYENDAVIGLEFRSDAIADISPVRALTKLRSLRCGGTWRNTVLQDLSPLKGMSLKELVVEGTRVADLSPLMEMKLEVLRCGYTQVADLKPLSRMTLTSFNCWHTPVSDLSPLNPSKLTTLEFNGTAVPDLTVLKNFKLKSIGFTATKISDLGPLRGMPLEGLDCALTPVTDLSPLASIKLRYLNCGGTRIDSLQALKESELTSLICMDTQVSDLAPIQGKKITSLYCGNTLVSDLTPLVGMNLVELHCEGAKITNHSPLKGMSLERLSLDFKPERDTEVLRSLKSLKVVNGMPVEKFWMNPIASKPEYERFVDWVKMRGGSVSPEIPMNGERLQSVHLHIDPTFKKPINDEDLENFKDVPEVSEINIRSQSITSRGMVRLGQLMKNKPVNTIMLFDIHMGLDWLREPGGLSDVKVAVFQNVDATNDQLRQLANFPKLESIGLKHNPKITDAGIAHLKKLTKLKSIDLSSCGLSESGLAELRSLLPGCQVLPLPPMPSGVTGTPEFRAFVEWVKSRGGSVSPEIPSNGELPHMVEMHIDPAKRRPISDEDIDRFRDLPGVLNGINFRAQAVTTEGLIQLGKIMADKPVGQIFLVDMPVGLDWLREPGGFSIIHGATFQNINATDEQLENLKKLPRLGMINLRYNKGITDKSIDLLIARKSLETVHLDESGVSEAGLARLRAARPELKVTPLAPDSQK